MRFTANEMVSIEKTMDKLMGVVHSVWSTESTDGANARYIAYLISEMRASAQLINSGDEESVSAGHARVQRLITK